MSGRTERVSGLEIRIEERAQQILGEFRNFADGIRYVALLHRTKDGGENTEYQRRGGLAITHDEKDYYEALVRLLTLQAVSSKPYRLYASVNPRDLRKAEHKFKEDMLTVDFAPQENKDYFWTRLESKWASALMSPGSRAKSNFMIDVDGDGDITAPALQWLAENGVEYIKMYQTPNGWHIITPPFNPTNWNPANGEIKKDGLILLSA